MKVIKSQFSGLQRDGDFSWMINRPEYARSLFVFNDNEAQFIAFHKGGADGLLAGGGNATIRPYQGHSPIRAAGTPTGTAGCGYTELNHNVRALIDDAIAHIRRLLATGNYDQVIFSYDSKKKTLGTKIYSPADEVKNYIYQAIVSLEELS